MWNALYYEPACACIFDYCSNRRNFISFCILHRKTLWRKLQAKGFEGKFLASLQALYDGDYVTSMVNGVSTRPVHLGRGLRQGCSLSPLLFALYISELGEELAQSKEGVLLHKIVVSAIFFAVSLVFSLNSFLQAYNFCRRLHVCTGRPSTDLKNT